MRPFLELVRWKTTGIAACAAFVGAGGFRGGLSAASSASVVGLICAAGFALNDWYDWEIDAVNAPSRPIPSGRITRRAGLFVALGAFGVGNLIAGIQGLPQLGIAALVSFLLYVYSAVLKRLGFLGNIVTAFVASLVFLYVGVSGRRPGSMELLLMTFTYVLAREILLDVNHIEGDKAGGRRTLPIVYHEQVAVALSRLLFFVSGAEAVLFAFREDELRVFFLLCAAALILTAIGVPHSHAQERMATFARWTRLVMVGTIVLWGVL